MVHDLVRRRFDGDRSPVDGLEPWPAVQVTDEAAWRASAARALASGRAVLAGVQDLADAALDEPFVEGAPSRYEVLHGLLQHDLYHAGQIALLRKADGG